MKNLKPKLLFAFALIFTINFAFSQRQYIDSLQVIIPKGLETFTKKIKISNTNIQPIEDTINLRLGFYKIINGNQTADFFSENNLIKGTVISSEKFKKGEHKEGELFRTEYKFKKSFVTEHAMFADGKLFVKAYQKDNQAFAKEFYKKEYESERLSIAVFKIDKTQSPQHFLKEYSSCFVDNGLSIEEIRWKNDDEIYFKMYKSNLDENGNEFKTYTYYFAKIK